MHTLEKVYREPFDKSSHSSSVTSHLLGLVGFVGLGKKA